MQIIEIDPKELKFSDYNPRKMTEKEEKDLTQSIRDFGFVDPLIVNKHPGRENVVVGGHQRLKIAILEGFKMIPVVYVDLDEKRERELNLRLNKNLGEWDWTLLANFDEDMLKLVGFNSPELDKIFDLKIAEDEFDADKEYQSIEAPQTQLGDLYQLEEHKLLCGDSTKKENFEKLMGDEKAQMIFTDPPYGINLNTDFSSMIGIKRGKKYRKVINDNIDYNPQHIFDFFGYCKEIFLWGADYYAERIPNRLKGSWFVWDKTGSGIDPNTAYEKQFGSNFELCWSKKRHKRQIIPCLWKGIFGLSQEDIKKRIHPTQKPLKLCKWFIERFSKHNEIIVDLFGGSGSTLIASEELNRKCYMMEIDPKYCDVIIKRWELFTGQKAIKVV